MAGLLQGHVAAVTGGEMRIEWASPFFLTLPLLLLRLAYPPGRPRPWPRFVGWTSGLSLAMALTYVLIFTGRVPVLEEAKWAKFPVSALSSAVSAAWGEVCPGPLPVVVGAA